MECTGPGAGGSRWFWAWFPRQSTDYGLGDLRHACLDGPHSPRASITTGELGGCPPCGAALFRGLGTGLPLFALDIS